MSDLMNWLQPRLVDVPDSLRGRIVEAIKSGPASRSPRPQGWAGAAEGHTGEQEEARAKVPSISDQLASLAEALMQEAKSAPPTHETAMTLLTADALITFACEAVADLDPERLADIGCGEQ